MATPRSNPTDDTIFNERFFSQPLTLTEALKTLNPHDHLCLIYETKEEWRHTVISFIKIGLQRNEKCMYIVDTHTADHVRECLGEEGVDVAAREKSGQLVILHESDAYTRDRVFSPDKMIALLIEETKKALSEGYAALRVTGEMSWALRGHPGSENLIEYEAKLNRDVFPHYPCVAICQYHRGQFDPETIRHVIMTHPLMVRNNRIYHNPYYIPPDEFLSQKRNHYEVEHWLQSLEYQFLVAEVIQRSEELETLNEISATITQSLELDVVLDVALKKTLHILNSEGGLIHLWDEPSQAFIPAAHYGLSHTIRREITALKMGEGLSGRAAQRGNPVVVSDLTEDFKTIFPILVKEGWRSLVSVPLKAKGELVGVLTIASRSKARFGPEHLSLLSSIGNQIGVAIYNAQLYEARQRELTERTRAEEALRKSEEQFRRMADNIQDGLTILEGEKVVYVNDRVCEILGYSKDELTKLGELDIAAPEEKERIKEVMEQAHRTGRFPGELEFWILRKDSTRRYIRNRYSVSCKGNVRSRYIVTTDVSDHKRAEEAIRESEEKYRTFVQNLQGIAYKGDMNWIPTFFHGAVEEITGYTEEEFLAGTPRWDQVIYPDDWPTIAESAQNIKTTPHYSTNREYRIIRKDNEVRWIQEFIQNVCDDSQAPVYVQGMIYDITERRQAEERIMQLSAAVRMSSDCIIIINMEGNIIDANEVALNMYRAHSEDFIGKKVTDIVAPEDHEKILASIGEVLKEGYCGSREHDIIAGDGTRLTVETHMVLIKTADGIPQGVVSISRDITERKKAEREMKRKLMRYNLEEGNIYLAKEDTPRMSIEAFQDLLMVGYPGLAISRTPKQEFTDKFGQEFNYLWIAEKGDTYSIPPDVKEIQTTIEMLTKPTAVFIDRLDYLMSKTSFKEILFFIQRLREICYLKTHVIILSVDPSTIDSRELRQIEKETAEIEPLYKTKLPEELIKILEVVHQQNTKGVNPSYTNVGQQIGASKPTTRKRIRTLINYGYVKESKEGRHKVVYLTEKGRTLFLK